MAGFVFGHFVDGVVDGVVAQLLGAGGDGELAFAGAGFGFVALLEVRLGVPDDFAEEFGDAGGVVGLLEGVALEGVGDLRIALTLGLAAHREVHAHFGAFAGEMFLEAGPDLRVTAFGNAEDVLAGPLGLVAFLFHFNEFFGFGMAHRALCGRIFAFVDVSADEASEFFLHNGVILSGLEFFKGMKKLSIVQ